MSKTPSSGLTRSAPKRPQTTLLNSLDHVGTNWRALWTLAGLLDLCQARDDRPLDPGMIGEAGGMMLDQLAQMRATLRRLEKEIKR